MARSASRTSSLVLSTPPKRRRATTRASDGGIPRRTFSSVSRSTWNRISSSRSFSIFFPWKIDRTLPTMRFNTTTSLRFRPLRGGEHAPDRGGEALPALRLLGELLPAGARQAVEARPPVVLRAAPLRPDPALLLEPVQGRVERPLVDGQHVLRELLDPLRDAPAVHRAGRERLQDQDVQGPLQQIGPFRCHVWPPSPRSSTREHTRVPVEGLGEIGSAEENQSRRARFRGSL